MSKNEEIIALDVGEKRIGIARANTIAKLPEPLTTIVVDGTEIDKINELCEKNNVHKIIIGLPRNQNGEETQQSQFVRDFANLLKEYKIIWQDESLTSINAEQYLKQTGADYKKGDIDSLAATQILNDYLETI